MTTTEEVKIRELPEKDNIDYSDKIIVEDNDGTKIASVAALRSLMQRCIFYDTVEDMKSASLHEGDVVQTLGYSTAGDGGGAIYMIKYSPTDLNDGLLVHYLHTSDTLRAHLIHDGKINVLWAGAKGDGITNDYSPIRKALSVGIPVYFPNRKYKINTTLVISDNTKINFNGATLICESAPCLSLSNVSNIYIDNAKLCGKQGINIAASCSKVYISNCYIAAPSVDIQQQYGILINGAKDVTVSNCIIGDEINKAATVYGISIGIGTVNGSTVTPDRITIDKCNIHANYHCIESNSTTTTKGLTISECRLSGLSTDTRNLVETVGVWIGANDQSILISDCSFDRVLTGVTLASLVTPIVNASNLAFYDARYAYTVLSNRAILILSGSQSFYGSTMTTGTDCIFDQMVGGLIINTRIYKNPASGKTIKNTNKAIAGNVSTDSNYTVSFIASSTITSIALTDSVFNVKAYVTDGSRINAITGGVNGQRITIMAKPGLTSTTSRVIAGSAIKLGGGKTEATLPVSLEYNGSCWYEI